MKNAISPSPDRKEPPKEIFAGFSLLKLQEEVEAIPQEHTGAWEGELRRRIRHGIDLYFRILGKESMREGKTGDGAMLESVEAAAGAFAKSFFEKLEKEGFDRISAENRVVIFGGSSKGSDIILRTIRNIMEQKESGNLVGFIKKEIENLAVKTLSLSERDEDATGDLEGIDDLAGMIVASIIEYTTEFPPEIGDHSMLSTWGRGTAFTFLPSSGGVRRREAKKVARVVAE